MTCELYTLEYDGKRLRFTDCEDAALRESVARWSKEEADFPPKGWGLMCALGDEELLLCQCFRNDKGEGLFVLWDADGPLLAAKACGNLAYAQGLNHFAQMTANARYAADIFENRDDDDD